MSDWVQEVPTADPDRKVRDEWGSACLVSCDENGDIRVSARLVEQMLLKNFLLTARDVGFDDHAYPTLIQRGDVIEGVSLYAVSTGEKVTLDDVKGFEPEEWRVGAPAPEGFEFRHNGTYSTTFAWFYRRYEDV